MNKIYAYIFITLLVIGFIKWGHTQVWEQGYNAHKAEVADDKDDAVTEGQAKVKEVIAFRDKEKEMFRDKIKKIYIKADATGCRATKLVDMGISLQ